MYPCNVTYPWLSAGRCKFPDSRLSIVVDWCGCWRACSRVLSFRVIITPVPLEPADAPPALFRASMDLNKININEFQNWWHSSVRGQSSHNHAASATLPSISLI